MRQRLAVLILPALMAVMSSVSRADETAWTFRDPHPEATSEPTDDLASSISTASVDCQDFKFLRDLKWESLIQDITWLPGSDRMWAVGFDFAAGFDGLVFRSTDGGHYWHVDQPPLTSSGITEPIFKLYSVRFVTEQVGFIAGSVNQTDAGPGPWAAVIYRTADGGNTWTQVYQGPISNDVQSRVNDLEFASLPDAIYGWAVGSMDPVGNVAILHTSDFGYTWHPQTSGINAAVHEVDFVDTLHGYAIANLGYTLKTVDGGANWTIASEISDFYYGSTGIKFFDADVGIALNGPFGPLILRTVDGGANWSQIFVAPRELFALDFHDNSSGWAAGEIGTVVRTEDAGVTWTVASSPANIPYLYGVAAKEPDGAWIAGDATISYTIDAGVSWRGVEGHGQISGAILRDLDFINTRNGWVVGDQGEIVRTDDGGVTWQHQYGVTDNVKAIDFVNESVGWFAGDVTVWKSVNGGTNWSPQASLGTIIDLQFRNENLGFVSGINGSVYRTIDGGATWQTLATGTTEAIYGLEFVTDDTGFAVGWTGTCLRTDDGGDTWQPQSVPTTNPIYDASFVDESHGWLAGLRNIFGTTNGGQTWVTQATVTSVDGFISGGIDFFDANHGIAVGGRTGVSLVLATSDGGVTWGKCLAPNQQGQTLNPGQQLFDVRMFTETSAVACGVNGRVIQFGELPTAVQDHVPSLDTSLEILSVTPNPFSGGTSIGFRIAQGSNVKVEVFDVAGRRVFARDTKFLPAGDHTFRFDAVSENGAALPSGVYFQRLTALGVQKASKMVIVR